MLISIHALREEGDRQIFPMTTASPISIHALREEGDLPEQQLVAVDDVISIHALREEGDLREIAAKLAEALFLSTPSARRATAL